MTTEGMDVINTSTISTDLVDLTVEMVTLMEATTAKNVNITVGSFKTSIPTSEYAQFGVTLFFLIVGLFGNISAIIVMVKQRLKYSAHGTYITALAIADIKSLLLVTLNKPLLIDIFGIDVRAFTDLGCKLFKYIGRVSVISSSNFVVLICIERFIAVWFPLKAKFLLSKKRAVYSVCAIFGTLYVVNIPCMVYTGIKNGICLPDFALKPNHILPKFNSMLTWALHTMIPAIIMIILTPLTIIKLYRQKLIRKKMVHRQNINVDVTRRITFMLVSVVVTYFFLVCVSSVTFWVLNLLGINVLTSPSPWARAFRDIYETAELMSYSLNFFLYVVTSADFRSQIRQLFTGSESRSENFNALSELQSTTEINENPREKY